MPKCAICGDIFPNFIEIDGKKRNLQRRKYCLKCSPFGAHNTKTLEESYEKEKRKHYKYCKHCGKLLSNTKKTFCNNTCQSEYYYEQYIKRWKQGLENGISGKYGTSLRIRRYLLNKYGNKCCKCGWHEVNPFTNKVPLEIHHKDGDYTNNDEENLELLCPNCHSLTDTYKNGNANNGRKERSKYLI